MGKPTFFGLPFETSPFSSQVGQQDDGDVIKTGRRAPELGPPVAVEHRVSGRTGNFPEGSQE